MTTQAHPFSPYLKPQCDKEFRILSLMSESPSPELTPSIKMKTSPKIQNPKILMIVVKMYVIYTIIFNINLFILIGG